LQGDENLIVKCMYGLPEVKQLVNPVINPSFNAVTFNDLQINSPKNDIFSLSGDSVAESSNISNESGTLALIALLSIIGALFLIILLVMLIFICIKWCNDTKQKTSNGPNSSGNGSEICKYDGKQSWWTGSKEALQRNQQLINKE
uniref:Uncharacterized protein n=1 Tax=Parascaris univalens TaxID=6257 RepID=A0A915BGN4_PARUN